MNTDPGEEDEFISGHGWGGRSKAKKTKAKKLRGPFWTTREGVKMALRDMETSHIVNCMKHLKRRKLAVELEYLSIPEPNGEHAQDAFNSEIDSFASADVREVFPIYIKFEEELERREKRAEKLKAKKK